MYSNLHQQHCRVTGRTTVSETGKYNRTKNKMAQSNLPTCCIAQVGFMGQNLMQHPTALAPAQLERWSTACGEILTLVATWNADRRRPAENPAIIP